MLRPQWSSPISHPRSVFRFPVPILGTGSPCRQPSRCVLTLLRCTRRGLEPCCQPRAREASIYFLVCIRLFLICLWHRKMYAGCIFSLPLERPAGSAIFSARRLPSAEVGLSGTPRGARPSPARRRAARPGPAWGGGRGAVGRVCSRQRPREGGGGPGSPAPAPAPAGSVSLRPLRAPFSPPSPPAHPGSSPFPSLFAARHFTAWCAGPQHAS